MVSVSVPTPEVLLLDIEGCITSITFVSEILFPYARQRLASFLQENAENTEIQELLKNAKQIYSASASSADTNNDNADAVDNKPVLEIFYEWMDLNKKILPLKVIQGMIWKHGYQSKEIVGHVYKDAYECMQAWHQRKLFTICIYSSGSVPAQKLLFGYSKYGDLNELHFANFDIKTSGNKLESKSYQNICQSLNIPLNETQKILFVSDNYLELKAAQEIGIRVIQSVRDGVTPNADYTQITDFRQLRFIDEHKNSNRNSNKNNSLSVLDSLICSLEQ